MEAMNWNRICCPVDFSEQSNEALSVAAKLAAAADANLILLHVYQVPVFGLSEGSLLPTPEMLRDLADRVDERLAKEVEKAVSFGARRVTSLKIVGSPRQEVAHYVASSGVDLVVMGTEGRTGVRHALAGSVAERVVQYAACPVLVIPRKATLASTSATHPEDEETGGDATAVGDPVSEAVFDPFVTLANELIRQPSRTDTAS